MGILSRLFGERTSGKLPPPTTRIPGSGRFAAEVIGEARHTADLARILETAGAGGDEGVVEATLVIEDDDPHQTNAVPVQIAGCLVGYLSRATAQSCRALFSTAAGSGRTVTCTAKVRRLRGDGEPTRFQVQLDLPLDGA